MGHSSTIPKSAEEIKENLPDKFNIMHVYRWSLLTIKSSTWMVSRRN
jgi:hypothetical protein